MKWLPQSGKLCSKAMKFLKRELVESEMVRQGISINPCSNVTSKKLLAFFLWNFTPASWSSVAEGTVFGGGGGLGSDICLICWALGICFRPFGIRICLRPLRVCLRPDGIGYSSCGYMNAISCFIVTGWHIIVGDVGWRNSVLSNGELFEVERVSLGWEDGLLWRHS